MDHTEIAVSSCDVDVGFLIKLVKNFPYLYDPNYEEFKNAELKERTWNKISATLKIPLGDCQRIWKNLREKYGKEKRFSLNNTKVQSHWEFYDAMNFLQPFIHRRRRAKKKTDRTWSVELKNDIINIKNDNEGSANSDMDKTIISKIWDEKPVEDSISSQNVSFLGSELVENVEAEEITLDFINELPVKQESYEHENSVSIVRHQSSEEAFGAYVASRLIDFDLDERQAKKVKIFKILEDLSNI